MASPPSRGSIRESARPSSCVILAGSRWTRLHRPSTFPRSRFVVICGWGKGGGLGKCRAVRCFMTPERWAQIEELFHRVAECDPAQRASLLDGSCSGDADLRLE